MSYLISSLFIHFSFGLEQDDDAVESSKVSAGHGAANMIRLLIAGSQAGCLIGISGKSIENIRNSSGATISILAQNQLPSCASAHESDRLVQVQLLTSFSTHLKPV